MERPPHTLGTHPARTHRDGWSGATPSVEQRLTELLGPQFGRCDHRLDEALEELAGDELEELEEDVADAATAARTAAELDIESPSSRVWKDSPGGSGGRGGHQVDRAAGAADR